MMKHVVLYSAAFCLFMFSPLVASEGLDYLNALRTQAGLSSFLQEDHLDKAAQNHSDYLKINNTTGHYEVKGKKGFTGERPSDRVIYAGYLSRIVSENVSAGKEDVKGSIDGLFSAIYHRFGFLSLTFNEVGMGVSHTDNWDLFTYDMGNSKVRELCENGTYSGGSYVQNVCKDASKKLNNDEFSHAVDAQKAGAPELIVWPPVNGINIPPVFFEESPDPLPDAGVSGYPVSVEFNDGKFSSVPSVSSFKVKEKRSGTAVESMVVMDKANDPNKRLTDYQVAFFPKKRLKWGTAYEAELSYTAEETDNTKSWCFATRSLDRYASKVYRIEHNRDEALKAVKGVSYALYVVPENTNDILGSVTWRYNCDKVVFSYIDRNTVRVQIEGDKGEYVSFSFGNGQKIKLTIGESDTAKAPRKEVCSNDDNIVDTDGDGIADEEDTDDDNDGVLDENDAFPLDASESVDTDRDGIGNNADTDDDNDGILDKNDAFPLDASESVDTDRDGIGNNADTDDDNDGISDSVEKAHGLNPLDPSDAEADRDGDGFSNALEISLGSDFRSAASHPQWVPVMMGEIMIQVPVY